MHYRILSAPLLALFIFVALQANAQAATLTLDVLDPQAYGNSYLGQQTPSGTVDFSFDASPDENLTLRLTAFDIDNTSEVQVLVNNQSIGFLPVTGNNKTATATLSISASVLTPTNSLSFVVSNPGYKWGISNLLLSVVSSPTFNTLTIDVPESNSFGNSYMGKSAPSGSVEFSFDASPDTYLTLQLTAFDIDNASEVQVLVNNQLIGFLPVTGNNQTAPATLAISASMLASTNSLSFGVNNPGYQWGISDLLLSVDSTAGPTLTVGTLNSNSFGNSYMGQKAPSGTVDFSFDASPDDNLTLQLTAFDIDNNSEVQVLVNNQSIGFLPATGNNLSAPATLSIGASVISSTNSLSFVVSNPGYKWGISNLLLNIDSSPPSNTLTIDIPNSNSFGNNYMGKRTPSGTVVFSFDASSDENLTLQLTAFDIDNASEVQVRVNNQPVGFLPVTGNNQTATATLLINATVLSSTNSLSFDVSNPGYQWGISDLLLSVDSAVGIDLEAYSLIFNDEFDGSSLLASKWDTGLLWGPYLPINNEEQLYVDTLGMHSDFSHSPFEFTGSTLKITATPTNSSLQPPPRPPENSSVWNPRPYSEYRYNGPSENGPGYQASDVNYLSGIITTYESLKMTHGYVEMRAKLPAGRGLWPAFWLLTTHYLEDVPEIDVMEFLGQDVDRLYHTYHYFDTQDDWRKISTPTFATYTTDWTDDFHTFGMAWGPTEIIYYVDGVETHRITDQDYLITGQAMYLIANLAVGGNWPGAPDTSTQFPAAFEIDYIRAYERKLQPTLDLSADYQLMFEDNFNGAVLDANKWNTSFLWGPYFPINNEEQYYVDALGSDTVTSANTPFVLDNGVLSITARKAEDPDSFVIPEALPEPNAQIWTDHPTYQQDGSYAPGGYTSGIITSYDSFKFVNGYAEMRAKIPLGQGLWPAFWLLNAYYVGQQPEIDILEVLGHNPHQTFHTFHRLGEGGISQSDQGFNDNGNPAIGYADGFHTYGVRWQRGRIEWYIDGNVVHTYQGTDVPYQLMYVIANLAVGGNWPGSPDSSTIFPQSLDIDYIRVYQEKHKD